MTKPASASIPTSETKVTVEQIQQLTHRVYELEELNDIKITTLQGQLRQLQTDEIKQRLRTKRIVGVFAGLAVILMFGLIGHGIHTIMWKHFILVPSIYAVALIVAPCLSITTIVVTLLIGAYRKFPDEDTSTISSIVTDGIKGVTATQ